MMSGIATDISAKGPIAWLDWFEASPDFFMASEGMIVFANADSASSFIRNKLVKQIHTIDLRWDNMRIDPISDNFAVVAANWKENLTDFSNNKISEGGYFTGLAEKTSKGWQLRNCHWSVSK